MMSTGFYPYIPKGIYGRGKKAFGYSNYGKKYKFRKRDIISPFAKLKLPEFKIKGGFKF